MLTVQDTTFPSIELWFGFFLSHGGTPKSSIRLSSDWPMLSLLVCDRQESILKCCIDLFRSFYSLVEQNCYFLRTSGTKIRYSSPPHIFRWFLHRSCFLPPPVIFLVGQFLVHKMSCAGGSQALSRPQDQLHPWRLLTVDTYLSVESLIIHNSVFFS